MFTSAMPLTVFARDGSKDFANASEIVAYPDGERRRQSYVSTMEDFNIHHLREHAYSPTAIPQR